MFDEEVMDLQRPEDKPQLIADKHEVIEQKTQAETPYPRESEGARAEILQALEEKRRPDPESYVDPTMMGVLQMADPLVQEGETVPETATQDIEV